MRRPLVLVVTILSIVMLGSACTSTLSDAATITYSLGGSSHEAHVGRDAVLNDVKALIANKQFATLLTQNGFVINGTVSAGTNITATWLTLLINQDAVDALFAQRHLTITPAMRAQARKDAPGFFSSAQVFGAFTPAFQSAMVERTARREALLASYTNVSDVQGAAYFRAHASEFACASGRQVAHILVASKAAAQTILDQLNAGASFAQLAQQKSTDAQSGAQGGNLGCLRPGEFVAPFQTAAEHAPFGKPIGPVQSQFGFHIILVTHATAGTYDSVRSQVLQLLQQQGRVAAQNAINDLLKAFHVHLDPRFGTWGPATDSQGQTQYQVTAPKVPQPNTNREGATTTTTLGSPPGSP